jgi:hypothetical protein
MARGEHKWYGSGVGYGATLCAAAITASVLLPATAYAGSAIAQGFKAANSDIVSGALVSLRSDTANTVELSTEKNKGNLLGVASKQSLIEFTTGSPVQVVTSGTTSALVSDINGQIKSGDRITASPISGIGMKATETSMVVGAAQGDLSLSSASTRVIKDLNGKEKTVHIGSVSLLVSPTLFESSNTSNTVVPSAFQDFASGVAGRTVSPVRVLMAGLLVLLLFVVVSMLLYSSVHASIISIGRNPLSQRAVRKSLFDVGITVLGMLAFTVIIVYLVLTT